MRRLPAFVAALVVAFPLLAAGQRDPGTAFAVAIEDHDPAAVKALLAGGASPDTPIDYGEHSITPLMKAAWDGDAEIVELLLAAGAKVNATAADTKETALMNAVSRDSEQIVEMLLKAGADVSLRNKFDFNAFTSAVAAGKEGIAGQLLAAGAKIEDGASGLAPLQFAASAGSLSMIRFLVDHGADVNRGAKSGGQTALLSAIYAGKIEAVKLLIELKASVNAKTKDGDTPLKAAQKGDQDDVIAVLKAAGAKS
ncbi:MAG: ankyrin repeat domain-containing protein [Acidobacteriota bacterium]